VRYYMENSHFVFLSPFGGLEATYDDHLRLIGKHVVDFLLMLIELFCKVIQLMHYERLSTENRQFRSNMVSFTQNFRQKFVTPHQPVFFSEN